MNRIFLLLLLSLNVSASQAKAQPDPLTTVPYVDIERYMGKWYEIASFPQRFQKNCTASTADYSLRSDGKVSVVNSCRDKIPSGPERVARGTARVVDKETNAKLKVTFFWPFSGDYWVIDLADDYSYAVVGHPSRTYLWILSRTPTMNEELYQSILLRLVNEKEYDLSPLQRTIR